MSQPLADVVREAGLPPPKDGDANASVSDVVYDSRRAKPGSIFVAVPGFHVDGHRFVADAVARGAVAVVAEHEFEPPVDAPTAVIRVPSSRAALAALAAVLAGHPSRDLTVAGITGTDGKTTTATMLWSAWRRSGIVAGSLTTIDFRQGDVVRANESRQTTLEAVELQERLRAMRDSGCSHVALETSSHALALERVATIEFRAAIYTRITSEHLELHGTRKQYLEAKSRLLALVGARRGGIAVLDRDDPFGFPRLTRLPVDQRLTYSAEGNKAADAVARDIAGDPGGLRLTVDTPWGTSPLRLQLPGRFNAANALAALCAACATGAQFESALTGLEELDRVRGRMERIDAGQPFTVVIDYAHTEEALDEVLQELRPITPGRIWAVFGSAGERDREKRPAMGRVAARRSDRIVLTDEDPREEDRLAILEEIAAGATATGGVIGENVFLIPDRAEAIHYAISAASPGDTVLLAGKGHESSLITSSGPAAWNERAAAESALRERGFSRS